MKVQRSKNMKFIVGGSVLLLSVLALVVQAVASTGAYYMTVNEVQSAAPSLEGKRIRVNGLVVAGSEDWNAEEIVLRFAIADEISDAGEVTLVEDQGSVSSQLSVVFYGPKPDNFQRAESAIVEGELLPNGTFKADTLLLKCPSRYEEEPEEVFIEATR